MFIYHFVLIALFFVTIQSLSLPSIFASHAVLPSDKKNLFWGLTTTQSVNLTISPVSGDSVQLSAIVKDGFFAVWVPEFPSGQTPFQFIVQDDENRIILDDIVFGYVYLCSGQSNMQLSVFNTVNATDEIQMAAQVGEMGVRILQVPLDQSYCEATKPAFNFTPSIPWSVAGENNVGAMSAVCYYFGKEHVTKYKDIPVGLIATSWGGTAIEVWMSPEALSACGSGDEQIFYEEDSFVDREFTLERFLIEKLHQSDGLTGCHPSKPSSLYYSMIYPFLTIPVKGFLWYQGESNAGDPVKYSKCFPMMINQWRNDWKNHSQTSDPKIPFLFVQLSSWPAGNTGTIPSIRMAQTTALNLENVGMAVAADIGDPSSASHPIHPPFKQEVSRRLFLAARNIIFGDSNIPSAGGPSISGHSVDRWDPSWGNFHFGAIGNICKAVQCLGIRIFFNEEIIIQTSYGRHHGMASGFEVVSKKGEVQPITLMGTLEDKKGIQLNVTFIYEDILSIRYGWSDYPEMTLFNSLGQPVPPFNMPVA